MKVRKSQVSISSSLWCQIRDSDYIIILKSYQSSLNSSVYPVLHGKLSKPYKTNLLQQYDILAIFHFNLNRRSRTIVEHVRSTWVSEKLVQSVLQILHIVLLLTCLMAALPWILTAEQYIELSQYLQQFLVVSSLTRDIYRTLTGCPKKKGGICAQSSF